MPDPTDAIAPDAIEDPTDAIELSTHRRGPLGYVTELGEAFSLWIPTRLANDQQRELQTEGIDALIVEAEGPTQTATLAIGSGQRTQKPRSRRAPRPAAKGKPGQKPRQRRDQAGANRRSKPKPATAAQRKRRQPAGARKRQPVAA